MHAAWGLALDEKHVYVGAGESGDADLLSAPEVGGPCHFNNERLHDMGHLLRRYPKNRNVRPRSGDAGDSWARRWCTRATDHARPTESAARTTACGAYLLPPCCGTH